MSAKKLSAGVVLLLFVLLLGICVSPKALEADFSQKMLPPSLLHFFGTDQMGRDMFLRTVKGLSTSLLIGAVASMASALLALLVGGAAGIGTKSLDGAVCWLIDLVMGIPHIVLLILISFALGRGQKGVMVGIILTHWTGLARIIRAEVLQLRQEPYIQISKRLGKNALFLFRHHMIPHIVPQLLTGLFLLFPHAILHEASITFLGFGLSPEQPAIGIILSESMNYLTAGVWWLAFFPGALLVGVVLFFSSAGHFLQLKYELSRKEESV